jgi:hypothetical protein
MARGLDHIVHAVRDLDAAADTYRRFGFTVGARNRHPWGTHNHLVQFQGFFIEILTVAEPEKLGDDGFSKRFGDFNRRFLERREGFSLLILESHDAKADEGVFEAASLAASGAMRFEREGRRPDGMPVRVAFSLVFARDPLAPDVGLAVCQQHYPENFWNAAFRNHANGASDVAGVVMVAANPADHQVALSAFAGVQEVQSASGRISIATPRGDIAVMTPAAFEDDFGVTAPDRSGAARLAALRLACPDLSTAENSLAAGGIEVRRHRGRLVVPPNAAFGATLVFEAMQR